MISVATKKSPRCNTRWGNQAISRYFIALLVYLICTIGGNLSVAAQQNTNEQNANDQSVNEPEDDNQQSSLPEESESEQLYDLDSLVDESETTDQDTTEISDEAAELQAFQQAYERYTAENEDYFSTIEAIVEAEYNRRLTQINQSYEGKIRSLETVERLRREEAIDTFEQFVERYPDDPNSTPDALFRLAELYFEKANDDFMLADEAYQEQRELYDMGRIADPPQEISRDYSNSMAIFQRLIDQWPQYRQIDGAYYLLAYSKLQMGETEQSRELLATLIQLRPDSVFAPEAWMRIGEYHFDFMGGGSYEDLRRNLELAKQAYQKVLTYENSGLFDKALYKLAWTHYRLDDFPQAIEHFKQLVEYSDEEERRTGRSGAVLRTEAVQYIAISLAEEDWNLDGVRDDAFGLPRVKQYLRGEHRYEREVLIQLAEYLVDRSLYQETLGILEYILERYPTHRENPAVHQQIIVALHGEGRREEAYALRRNLVDYYGVGSEWHEQMTRINAAESLRRADNFVRESLLMAATWYHEQAQNLRAEALATQDESLLDPTEQRYAMAASGYEEYLKRYPTDREVYQWNFYLAECLYYSAQYMRAFEQYQAVRELDIPKNEYQEISAFNAIKALEFAMAQQVSAGELDGELLGFLDIESARQEAQALEQQREIPEDERGRQLVVVEAKSIPEIVHQYVTAMDRYVVLRLENEEDSYLDAKFAFQAAKIYYDFKDYEEARRRFAWIVRAYSEHEVAYLAGSLILESYRDENNYTKLAEWAEILGDVIQGEQAEAVRAEVREFRLGGLFLSAEELFSQEKYEEAAAEYIRLVDEAPEHRYAPRALNNAAVAYELLRRFDTAMRLYERVYENYPEDPLSGYALFRVAVNSEQFFEFDRAILHYQMFYELFEGDTPPELESIGFDVEENRVEALKSVAVLLENMQRYEEAANKYIEFAQTYPNDENADDGLWQAVLVWERMGRPQDMIRTIRLYTELYGANPDNATRVLEGMMKTADHYEESGDRQQAARWYRNTIAEYNRRNLQPASSDAFFAAKAQFMLAEHEFIQWQAITIDGPLNRQQRLIQEKVQGQLRLTEMFNRTMGYRSLEWTMAANFRIGSLFQNFANALYEVPIPFEEGSEHYEMYQIQLEDIAIPLEDQAIERYEATIERARQDKIVNEWTKKTLEELNKYNPSEYPLFKEERRAYQMNTVTGQPLLDMGAYNQWKDRENPDDDDQEDDNLLDDAIPEGEANEEEAVIDNSAPASQNDQLEEDIVDSSELIVEEETPVVESVDEFEDEQ